MKRIMIILIPILVLILEILPYGAVLIFAPLPTETQIAVYSYFDLKLIGYGSFSYMITALLTCMIIVGAIVQTLKSKEVKVLQVLEICAIVMSVIPIFGGTDKITLIGVLIFILLIVELVISKLRDRS